MANKAGFNAADVGGIIRHYTREKDESGQYQEYPRKEGGGHIDPSKTCENYQLGECHDEAWVRERLRDVYQRPQDRGHKPVMVDIVVTFPRDEPPENEGKFFQAAYDSLARKFGRNGNIVGAWVHKDEAQPHLHFAFLPVVPKSMKTRPEVREGISQAAYFPKKSSLREMHETLQEDISRSLGHRVAILNGATKQGNQSVTELKNQTLKELREGGRNFRQVKDIVADIEVSRGWLGGVTYKADKETFDELIRLASVGAKAVIIEREREQAVVTARTREQQADKERVRAEKERDESLQRLERVRADADIYLRVPDHLRGDIDWGIEDTRQRYRDYADTINRRVCRVFLSCGRDIKATREAMGKELETIGIPPKDQWQYIKSCLTAVSRQAHKAKQEGKHTPPARGDGWNTPPRETDFSILDLLPNIQASNEPIPNLGNMMGHGDDEDENINWNLLSIFEREEIERKRMIREL